MIKRIKIDNFKSLNDFIIDLKPLTVIVGNNAMGKSSILQAIAFLANCTVEDFGIILERRNWTVSNVKSRVGNANNSRISFETLVQLGNDELCWTMILQTNVKKILYILYRKVYMIYTMMRCCWIIRKQQVVS